MKVNLNFYGYIVDVDVECCAENLLDFCSEDVEISDTTIKAAILEDIEIALEQNRPEWYVNYEDAVEKIKAEIVKLREQRRE